LKASASETSWSNATDGQSKRAKKPADGSTARPSIEAIAQASFLSKDEKQPYVRLAIRKIDTLRVLLMVLWETKSLDNKKYIALSTKLDDIGKMLGGWNGQLTKQNSPK
jgi:hypothetical protein